MVTRLPAQHTPQFPYFTSIKLPRYMWVAVLAFGLQFLVVKELSHPVGARVLLGISHSLLVLCVLRNWRLFSFRALGVGLALNLLVIYSNGGLMPVAPEAVQRIGIADSAGALGTGQRIGAKNVLLDPQDTL